MCLLSYFLPGVQPDCSALFNGTMTNNDGHGFAIVTGDRLIVRHGLRADDMVAMFGKLRRKHSDGPALFHSRFGTGGAYSRANCHPFYLGGDRRTVVAHNGILPTLVQPVGNDKRCDTRIAAEDIFPAFGDLNARDTRERLAAWIGPRNKLVILTTNPVYDRPAYLINSQSGIWTDGIWYSNYDYLSLTGSYASKPDQCEFCGELDVDWQLGLCLTCERCLDCGQTWGDECQCYYFGNESALADLRY